MTDTATSTSGPPREALGPRRPPPRDAGPARPDAAPPTIHRRHRSLHVPALIGLLALSLALRLWGIKQGLPFSYNSDEAQHFVPRAVGFFSQNLDPHYFDNPPAYSYLLHIVLELWFGSPDAVTRAYAASPTSVFVLARVLAAVLGTIAVLLTYLAATRFFNRSVALLAAAIFGFAYLPIFYSHLALNDVPTLAPLSLSLYGVAGVLRRGRRRDYAVAGITIGLAAATKYTGGITLVCLLVAAVCDGIGGRAPLAVRRTALALVLAALAFLLANPYAVLDPSAFVTGLSQQATGTDLTKLGVNQGSGILYYVWTFTWGLGMMPALAGLAGAVLLLARRRIALGLVLLPATIGFVVFMGEQQRFFGRWLMPVFPIVAMLGGYAGVELVRWLRRRRGVPLVPAGAIVAGLLLAQSVSAVVHGDVVLSRPDTRALTRAWMVRHIPAGARLVIEPVVPPSWASDVGRALPATRSGARWAQFPTWLTDIDANGNLLAPGTRRYVLVDQYERTLRPELLDEYVEHGYCWVVVGSLQAGRAFAQPNAVPRAIRYYAALAQRGRLVYHVSPFGAGDGAVPFSFDWSIDYYPREYALPGPSMSVYRLTGGRCS
jgi:hypothetical protein